MVKKRLTTFGSGNVGNNQEVQVQGTKHRCSVNYKTTKWVVVDIFLTPALHTVSQVSEREMEMPFSSNHSAASETSQVQRSRRQDLLACPFLHQFLMLPDPVLKGGNYSLPVL